MKQFPSKIIAITALIVFFSSCSGDKSSPGDSDNPEGSESVPLCETDRDCSGNEICGEYGNCIASCETDRNCSEGLVCKERNSDKVCIQTCLEIGECPEGEECLNGMCIGTGYLTCEDTRYACPEDYHCVEDNCVPPECADDSECSEGKECFDGECVDSSDYSVDPTNSPPECDDDSDCQEGEFCIRGVCVLGSGNPYGYECLTDSECEATEMCSDQDHECVPIPPPVIRECPFVAGEVYGDCTCPGSYSWEDDNSCYNSFFDEDDRSIFWSVRLVVNYVSGYGRQDKIYISHDYREDWRNFIGDSTVECQNQNAGLFDLLSNNCISISNLADSCREKLNSAGYCYQLDRWVNHPEDESQRWWIAPSTVCGFDALFNGSYSFNNIFTMNGKCVPCTIMNPVPIPRDVDNPNRYAGCNQ